MLPDSSPCFHFVLFAGISDEHYGLLGQTGCGTLRLSDELIDKMTTDLRPKNPEMAQQIRAWFARKQDGKPVSEGFEKFLVETIALQELAKEGKADLSKIQVEGVVVKIVKDKFPPQKSQK